MRKLYRHPLHRLFLALFLSSAFFLQNGFLNKLNDISANAVGESGTIGIEYSLDLDYYPFFCTAEVAALSVGVEARTGGDLLDVSPGATRPLFFDSTQFPNGPLGIDVTADAGSLGNASDGVTANINNPDTSGPCVAFTRVVPPSHPGVGPVTGPDASGTFAYEDWDIQVFFNVRPGCSRAAVRGPNRLEMREVGGGENLLCTAAMDPEDDEPNQPCVFSGNAISEGVDQLEGKIRCSDLAICGSELLHSETVPAPGLPQGDPDDPDDPNDPSDPDDPNTEERPLVGIATPADEGTVSQDTPIPLIANATDGDGNLASYEFFMNGIPFESGSASSASDTVETTFTFPAAGEYLFRAAFTDTTNLTGSDTHRIQVGGCTLLFQAVDGVFIPPSPGTIEVLGPTTVRAAARRQPEAATALDWRISVPSRGVSDLDISSGVVPGVSFSGAGREELAIDFLTFRLPGDPDPIADENVVLTIDASASDDPSDDCDEESLALFVKAASCSLDITSIQGIGGGTSSSPGTPFTTTLIRFQAEVDTEGFPNDQDPNLEWSFEIEGAGGATREIDLNTSTPGVTLDSTGTEMVVDFLQLAAATAGGDDLLNRFLTVRVQSTAATDQDEVCPTDVSRAVFVFDEGARGNNSSWNHNNPHTRDPSVDCPDGVPSSQCSPRLPPELTRKLQRSNHVGEEASACNCPSGSCTYVFNSVADPVLIPSGRLVIKQVDAGYCAPGTKFAAVRTYHSGHVDRTGWFGVGWRSIWEGEMSLVGDALLEVDGLGNAHLYEADGQGGFLPAPTTSAVVQVLASGDYEVLHPTGASLLYSGSTGRLLEVRDRNQNTYTVRHTSSGLVSEIEDPVGRLVTFTEDSSTGRVASMRLPNGDTWTYQYAPGPVLTAVSDPLGNTFQFQYDSAGRITRQIDPAAGSRSWAYDGSGRVGVFVDEQGSSSTITYDPANQRTTFTDSTGAATIYEYDLQGLPTRVLKPGGDQVSLEWSPNALLRSRTDELGRTASWTYDSENRVTSYVQADGDQETFVRNPTTGYLTQHTDASGETTQLTFDNRGNVLTVTDRLGRVETRAYDSRGHLLSLSTPLGRTTSHQYDAQGDRVRTVDSLGNIYGRSYDALSRLRTSTDPLGRSNTVDYLLHRIPARITDALGHDRLLEYDRVFNLKRRTDVDGASTTFTYETRQGTRVVTSMTDALGEVTTFEHDSEGRIVATIDPQGGRTETTFDSRGRPVKTTDALGNTSTNTYNADGTIRTQTTPLGHTTQFSYDSEGRQIRVVDPLGGITQTDYDEMGRVAQIIAADGGITQYVYDSEGRIIRTIDPRGQVSVTFYDQDGRVERLIDQRGKATIFEHDQEGRQTRITDPQGSEATTKYDVAGQVIVTTDPEGRATHYEYDQRGRRVKTIGPQGELTQSVFNPDGTLARKIDANGNTTFFEYDVLDRLTAIIDPLGNRIALGYDASGNRISLKDQNGNTTVFVFDALNRVVAMIDPLGRTRSKKYDADGRMVRSTNARGQVHTFGYDALGRLLQKQMPDGTETYAYDPVGRKVFAQNSPLTYVRSYDLAGNIISEIDSRGGSATHSYDAASRRFQTVDTFGRSTTRSFDDANRLVQVAAPHGRTITMAYNKAGQLTNRTRAGGMITRQTYDASGRLASIEHESAAGTVLFRSEYGYDPAGNRIFDIESSPGGSSRVDYTHDARHQLTAAQVTSGDPSLRGFSSISYTYDPAGNRLDRTVDGMSEVATFDAANQMVTLDGSPLTYDLDGNMLTESLDAGGTRFYAYDSENNLIETYVEGELVGGGESDHGHPQAHENGQGEKVGHDKGHGCDAPAEGHDKQNGQGHTDSNGAGHVIHHDGCDGGDQGRAVRRYAYMPDGTKARVQFLAGEPGSEVLDRTEERFWSLGAVVEDARVEAGQEADRALVFSHVQAGGPVATLQDLDNRARSRLDEQPGSDRFRQSDALGSTRLLLDEGDGVLDALGYRPFGQVAMGNGEDSFTFTGLRSEDVGGVGRELYAAAHRHLRPRLSRWTKRDPIGEAGGLNLYAYVENRTLVRADPTGLIPRPIPINATGLLSGNGIAAVQVFRLRQFTAGGHPLRRGATGTFFGATQRSGNGIATFDISPCTATLSGYGISTPIPLVNPPGVLPAWRGFLHATWIDLRVGIPFDHPEIPPPTALLPSASTLALPAGATVLLLAAPAVLLALPAPPAILLLPALL